MTTAVIILFAVNLWQLRRAMKTNLRLKIIERKLDDNNIRMIPQTDEERELMERIEDKFKTD